MSNVVPTAREREKSCRVYLVAHDNGCFTGILMRQWNVFFDRPPPSAYGASIDDVLDKLDHELAQRAAAGEDALHRYLWNETFAMRSVTVVVRPQTFVDKRPVIGAREFPLTLQYAACQLAGGAWRVGLPRFGWWMVLETLDLAKDALEMAIGAALLGEQERLVFEFRRDGRESVREWTSRLVDLAEDDSDEQRSLAEDYPITVQVADELVSRARTRRMTGTHGTWPTPLSYRVAHPWSTLLVGPHGVGKSARVRQLAKALAEKKRARKDDDERRLWHTSKDRILAGMMYLGMWEERVLGIVQELSRRGDWLYIERLADLLEPVGGAGGSGGSIGELLLPAVEARELFILCEATQEESDRLLRRHPRWYDALSLGWVSPPDPATLAAWIPSYTESAELKLGRSSGTPWERDGLRRLMQLQQRFEPALAQPGAAVRFITWWTRTVATPAPARDVSPSAAASRLDVSPSAAASRLDVSPSAAASRLDVSPSAAASRLDADAVTDAYARFTGLPIDMVSDRAVTTAQQIQAALEQRVVGQPRATAIAAKTIARFKAGLSDPARPIGTLLFVGPTGVGKTELAKAMCQRMFGHDKKLIRLDMSEYHLPWSAERLFRVGAVGDTGASLAERVRAEPIALVLLDEIEKAHPSIFDTLMAVLDEGRFTDQKGQTVDFRTTLIVMTSNLGAGGPKPTGFAGGMGLATGADYFGAARRWFRPELLNRIDHVIPFDALDRPAMDRIVALELARIVAREGLTRRGLVLEVAPGLAARLADEGYHPEYGARALRRVLEERLVVPLATLVAASPELRDLTIVASFAEGAVRFDTRVP